MSAIAIIGAGPLGGELGFALARADAASEVRLVDEQGQIATGKALDIQQAAPILGFATRVRGSRELATAAGASVMVIADQHGGGEWQGVDGLALMERLLRLGGHLRGSSAGGHPAGGVVVCAGAAHAELVERSVRDLGMARMRILGSAPEALAAGVRALVALEARCSPRDVALTVIGSPPGRSVFLWEDATIGGYAAARVLDEPARRRVAVLAERLWPPGPLTLAAAATRAVEALTGRSRASLTAFVAPDDSQGRRARTVALPVRLGPGGIAGVEIPPLSTRDRVALETTMLL